MAMRSIENAHNTLLNSEGELTRFVQPLHLRTTRPSNDPKTSSSYVLDLDLLSYFCAHSTAVYYRDGMFSIQAQPAISAQLEAKQRAHPAFDVNHEFQEFITQCTSPIDNPTTSLTCRSLATLRRLHLNIAYDPPSDGSCLFGSVVHACYGAAATSSIALVVAHVRMLKREIARALLKKLNADSGEQVSLDNQLSLIRQLDKLNYYCAPLANTSGESFGVTSTTTTTNTTTASESTVNASIMEDLTDDNKRATIRQFIDFLDESNGGGYFSQHVFGDEMDAQLLADLLRVNILIVNMDPGQPMPCIHRRSAYVRNSLQGDVHILHMIIPCRDIVSVQKDTFDSNNNENPIDLRLDLMYNNRIKPEESGNNGMHADMLRTRHTIVLGRVGQHYILLQPIHQPLIEAILTAHYTWLIIHVFDYELERLAIRRRELVRALGDMGVFEPFDADTSALTVVEPAKASAPRNSLDWLTNLAAVDAWRANVEQILPVFRFMLIDIVWPQVTAQFVYAHRYHAQLLARLTSAVKMAKP